MSQVLQTDDVSHLCLCVFVLVCLCVFPSNLMGQKKIYIFSDWSEHKTDLTHKPLLLVLFVFITESVEVLPPKPSAIHLLRTDKDEPSQHALLWEWRDASETPWGHDCRRVWLPLISKELLHIIHWSRWDVYHRGGDIKASLVQRDVLKVAAKE